MARVFDVHPDNPQPRSLSEAVHLLRHRQALRGGSHQCARSNSVT